MKKNIYALTGTKTLNDVAATLEQYLSATQKMETQLLTANDGSLILQARGRHDGAKQFFGMDKAITVKLVPLPGSAFQAEVGNGQWLKKSLALIAGTLLLSPLLLTTTTIGISNQGKLPRQIEEALQRYLADLPIMEKTEKKEKKKEEKKLQAA